MNKLILTALALTLTACSSGPSIDHNVAKYESWWVNRHVDKASALRGPFCNGKEMTWYYEGEYSISGTCKDGTVFSLRKDG